MAENCNHDCASCGEECASREVPENCTHACSTCGESLSLGAMCVAAGYADHVVTMTSSHFASAEKQFRFPLGNSYLVQVLDIKYKASNFKGFIQINFFYYSMPKFLFSFLI